MILKIVHLLSREMIIVFRLFFEIPPSYHIFSRHGKLATTLKAYTELTHLAIFHATITIIKGNILNILQRR